MEVARQMIAHAGLSERVVQVVGPLESCTQVGCSTPTVKFCVPPMCFAYHSGPNMLSHLSTHGQQHVVHSAAGMLQCCTGVCTMLNHGAVVLDLAQTLRDKGANGFDFVFIDHVKQAYLQDLLLLRDQVGVVTCHSDTEGSTLNTREA